MYLARLSRCLAQRPSLLYTPNRSMARQQTLASFFQMPKGMKSAPPQQASLNDMWGKGKSASRNGKDAPGKKNGAQESKISALSQEQGASENLKRKSPPSDEPNHRRSSKRKAVESEDENSADEGTSKSALISRSVSPETKSTKLDTLSSAKGKEKVTPNEDDEAASELEESLKSDADEAEGEEEVEMDVDADERAVAHAAVSKTLEWAKAQLKEVEIEKGWKDGDPVPYSALTKTFALIEATTKRLEKTAILTYFFLLVIRRSAKGDSKSLLQSVYLCINRLCPDYEGIELGIGESLLIKAIAESTGRSLALIKADLKKEGDLGLVAMNSKANQKTIFKPKPLTVASVFSNLREIALSSGHSSQNKKVSIITKLLAACQDFEAKYIVRSLEGKLRIGNAERTVLVALAHAVVLSSKDTSGRSKDSLTSKLEEGANIVKAVYSELPSYDLVVPALLDVGVDGLRKKCKLSAGVPLKPMLAKPTKAIGEVLDRFEGKKFTCEYKYDGERAQVHRLEDGTIRIFSRNSEDMSKKYPDLVDQLPRCIKDGTKSFVFDSEAVAIDTKTGKLLPFQELSRRKRKDVKLADIEVRVCLFAFDLIFLNGEPLLQRPLVDRRLLLHEHFQLVEGEFQMAKSCDGESLDVIQAFLEESVKDGCEGLMVKLLDGDESHYEPSRRSINWLKLKKDYLAGVGDSLDLVVVGGYYGKGKRTNVYGAFLLACYDADAEEYQTICKIGTGFSDEALQSHYDVLKPLEITKVRGDIKMGGAKPDVWFTPQIVWEVLTADLSLSPVYTAAQGIVDQRGISLRFPRFIRVRDDKSADDATGPEQVAEMYERQSLSQGKGSKKKQAGGEDDGFW